MTDERTRPRAEGAPNGAETATASTIPDWHDVFGVARVWVRDVARERWPDHPTNDDIWALSVTDWWLS